MPTIIGPVSALRRAIVGTGWNAFAYCVAIAWLSPTSRPHRPEPAPRGRRRRRPRRVQPGDQDERHGAGDELVRYGLAANFGAHQLADQVGARPVATLLDLLQEVRCALDLCPTASRRVVGELEDVALAVRDGTTCSTVVPDGERVPHLRSGRTSRNRLPSLFDRSSHRPQV